MQNLLRTLSNYDLEMLRVIANRWDIDLNTRDAQEAASILAEQMLRPEKVSDVWDRLTDEQRGVLQTLLAGGGKIVGAIFARMHGEIRPMGPDKLEREKPYLTPANLAEALYYRGLIATAVARGASWAYVPTDLAPLMPIHKTGYKVVAEGESLPPLPQPPNVRPSDTSLVDDLTTLLAYSTINEVRLEQGGLIETDQKALKAHLLGSNTYARLGLIVTLAMGMGIAAEVDGMFRPASAAARKWLDLPRSEQVRTLAETWRDSTLYNELWFTPGLKPERGRWENDPLLARQTVLTFLEMVPSDNWWQVDEFINSVKEEEPDFQRPTGDYDSWYIRDAKTGSYLRGFDSWDKVDGAMLRFILIGPLHGLALVDTADNGAACRLTRYGRAFVGLENWPATPDSVTPLAIKDDGTCSIPRAASRYDRFQLARFTEWLTAGDPYVYQITAKSLERASERKIQIENILTFLKRLTNDNVPQAVVRFVSKWGEAGTEGAILQQLIVLRLPSAELMETVQSTPALRRYLGMTLGPMAVAVRPDQWRELVLALQENGIPVEVEESEE